MPPSYFALDLGTAPLERVTLQIERALLAARQHAAENWGAPRCFILGLTGSVAAGKSTLAQNLAQALAPLATVEVLSTDMFLLSNAALSAANLLDQKGFPGSYDLSALTTLLQAIKNGAEQFETPIYSHDIYDILPEHSQNIRTPQILILEGINVLQCVPNQPLISDFLDYSIFLEAEEADLLTWFTERFLRLRAEAAKNPKSFFQRFLSLSEPQTRALAQKVWDEVNGRNYHQNILPTRPRADLVLHKGADHQISKAHLRIS